MYLDSCLHCGASHPEITSYLGQPLRHRIKCTECPHVIECFSSSIHQAKDAWNRRSDASIADAQAEIARLRGALGEARRRISEDLLGADSQDRRIIEEIDDAITVALDTK